MVPSILGGGLGEGLADEVGVEDDAHAEGEFEFGFLEGVGGSDVVVVLADHDAEELRGIAWAFDKDRAAAISGEGGEVAEEGGIVGEGEGGRAGDGSLAGDREGGGIGLEAFRIGEQEDGAADGDLGGDDGGVGEEAGFRKGFDVHGQWGGEDEDCDVLFRVLSPEGFVVPADGDAVVESLEGAIVLRLAEDDGGGFAVGVFERVAAGYEIEAGVVIATDEHASRGGVGMVELEGCVHDGRREVRCADCGKEDGEDDRCNL